MIDMPDQRAIYPMDLGPSVSKIPREVDLDIATTARRFEPQPPYPAGPILTQVKYPRDVCCPKYICPFCKQQFLFHTLDGVLLCPFCYQKMAVGRYNHRRFLFNLAISGAFLFVTILLMVLYFVLDGSKQFLIFGAVASGIAVFVALIKAIKCKEGYEKATMVEE